MSTRGWCCKIVHSHQLVMHGHVSYTTLPLTTPLTVIILPFGLLGRGVLSHLARGPFLAPFLLASTSALLLCRAPLTAAAAELRGGGGPGGREDAVGGQAAGGGGEGQGGGQKVGVKGWREDAVGVGQQGVEERGGEEGRKGV